MAVRNLQLAQSKFLIVYFISLVLCFSPFKILSLVSPFLIIFLMIFFVNVKSHYNIIKLMIFVVLYGLIGLFYFKLNEDFLWTNFLFYICTHAPFLFLLMSFKEIADRRMLQRLTSLTVYVLLFEAIIGMTQVMYRAVIISHGFDGGTGDSAMGTVNPTFGVGDGLASNVYFAIGLSALTVLAIVSRLYDKRTATSFAFFLILLAWIMASVMHSIFLMMAAIFITSFILVFFMPKGKLSFFKKQLNAIKSIMAVSVVVTICLLVFLPSNFQLLKNYYEHTFDPEKMQSTKSIATLVTIRELGYDKPYQKYIGLGPGQYSSRASLILSDEYLSSEIPDFMKSLNADLDRYILPIWRDYKSTTFQAGSTYFPFYSWLSLYGEWGLAGWAIVVLFILGLFKKMIARVKQDNFHLVIGLFIVIIYLFLLGVQDNYWEWGQFVLPILIYAKTVYLIVIKSEALTPVPGPAPQTSLSPEPQAHT